MPLKVIILSASHPQFVAAVDLDCCNGMTKGERVDQELHATELHSNWRNTTFLPIIPSFHSITARALISFGMFAT